MTRTLTRQRLLVNRGSVWVQHRSEEAPKSERIADADEGNRIELVSFTVQQYPEPVQDIPDRKPKLLERVRLVMRARHMSLRTEQAYAGWIRRYVRYHGLRHPSELGERGVVAFVTDLVATHRVRARRRSRPR